MVFSSQDDSNVRFSRNRVWRQRSPVQKRSVVRTPRGAGAVRGAKTAARSPGSTLIAARESVRLDGGARDQRLDRPPGELGGGAVLVERMDPGMRGLDLGQDPDPAASASRTTERGTSTT